MDLSKLPKLSQSPAPPPADAPVAPPAAPIQYGTSQTASPGVFAGPEIWIAGFMGIIFMIVGGTFAKYLVAKMSGQTFHTNVTWTTGERADQEVGYWELQGHTALSDSAIFLFGLSMLLEAFVMAASAKPFRYKLHLVVLAFVIAAGATIYNLIVVMILFADGITPLYSIVAVGFGAYIAWWEWNLLQSIRAGRETSFLTERSQGVR